MMLRPPKQICPLVQTFAYLILLVLGIASLPFLVEGLTCYSCDQHGCDHPARDAANQTCPPNENACFRSGEPGFMKRGCYPDYQVNCHTTAANSDACASLDDEQYILKREECIEAFRKANPDAPPPKGGSDNGTIGHICVCGGDHCNGDQVESSGGGLKCYACRVEENCITTPKEVTCLKGELCAKVSEGGSVRFKSCSGRLDKCFRGHYEECFRERQYSTQFTDCIWGKSYIGQGDGELTVCRCNTTFCNHVGHLTSNRKLTLFIITFLIYVTNYIFFFRN